MADNEVREVTTAGETGEAEVLFTPVDIFSSEDIKQQCQEYLNSEIQEVKSDNGRTDFVDRLTNIRRQRQAKPENDTKDFPWPNASNLEVTQAMEKTHLATTKLLNYFNGRKPMFTYKAEEAYKSHAKAITDYVNKLVENPNQIGLRDKLWEIFYTCASEGTAFIHVPFSVEKMKFKRTNADGSVTDVERTVKAAPNVNLIQFEDFFTRPDWYDLQRAPWFAVRYPKYYHELKALEQAGFYENVDLLLENNVTVDDKREEQLNNLGLSGTTSTEEPNRVYDIYEVRMFWDADGDGYAEDLLIHYEAESDTILRAEYNDLGMRDVIPLTFIKLPKILYGLGVGHIMEQLQIEGTMLHNMIIDTTQLAAMGLIVTQDESTLGSVGIYPGAMKHTPDPKNDINQIIFKDVGPTTLQAEMINRQTADTATGLSSALSGQDVGGSNRVGATGTQFLAQQSNSMIDTIAEALSRRWSEIGQVILYQLTRNYDYIDISLASTENQQYLQEVFSANVEDLTATFSLETATTSIKLTDEYRKETAMQLFNMYAGYGERLIQVSQMLDNPQLAQMPTVAETIQTYFVGLTKLMSDIMSQYNEFEVGDFLPFIKDKEFALEQADVQRSAAVSSMEVANYGATAGTAAQSLDAELASDADGNANNVSGGTSGPVQQAAVTPGGNLGGEA